MMVYSNRLDGVEVGAGIRVVVIVIHKISRSTHSHLLRLKKLNMMNSKISVIRLILMNLNLGLQDEDLMILILYLVVEYKAQGIQH